LLIYGDENFDQNANEAQQREIFTAYMEYTKALKASGVMLGGDALRPTSTATTIRIHDEETTVTDGPFAETTEQLGGYYLIDVENLDDALMWAKKCPGARYGSIEVRPVMIIEGAGGDG
jgi:hypothetical protein